MKAEYIVSALCVGEQLPFLAELCIRSYLQQGVCFQLFTYTSYDNIPEGTLVRDANELIAREDYFEDSAGGKKFHDWFRNKYLYEHGGMWTQLDMLCISPDIPMGAPVWFAQQEEAVISDAVLAFPAKHPVMKHLYELSEDPAHDAPWDDGSTRLAKYHLRSHQPDARYRREHAVYDQARFAQMLDFFHLRELAAPAQSINAIHYTVWRHCYDGRVSFDSPLLASSWAVNIWSELFEREPYEIVQIHPSSPVGHLIRTLAPQSLRSNKSYAQPIFTSLPSKDSTQILVGVCSCINAKSRRDTLRDTWMNQDQPGVQCAIFLGQGDGFEPEPDCVQLAANDTYDFLPEKVLAFFEYALAHHPFEWLFKCDDDTYLKLDRLADLCSMGADFVGNPWIETRGAPSGGAGYILSRKLVERILAHRAEIPHIGAEDLIIGEIALRLCQQAKGSDRLNYGNAPIPLPSNDYISVHWLSQEHMYTIHELQTQDSSFTLYACHPHWQDELLFASNGIFLRKSSACRGRWSYREDGALVLAWFDWEEEVLSPCEHGYQQGDFSLYRNPQSFEAACLLLNH